MILVKAEDKKTGNYSQMEARVLLEIAKAILVIPRQRTWLHCVYVLRLYERSNLKIMNYFCVGGDFKTGEDPAVAWSRIGCSGQIDNETQKPKKQSRKVWKFHSLEKKGVFRRGGLRTAIAL